MSDKVRIPKPQLKQGTFSFRTPMGLREKLTEAAAASNRSVSEEITYRLQKSFDEAEIRDLIQQIDVAGFVKKALA